jgi:hypothetical protein
MFQFSHTSAELTVCETMYRDSSIILRKSATNFFGTFAADAGFALRPPRVSWRPVVFFFFLAIEIRPKTAAV